MRAWCARNLHPRGLQCVAPQIHDISSLRSIPTGGLAFRTYLRPTNARCIWTPLRYPPPARLLHTGSEADDHVPSLVASRRDNDNSDGDDPQSLSTQEEKAVKARKSFRINIPKVNLDSALETMRQAHAHGLTLDEVVLKPSRVQTDSSVHVVSLKNEERLAIKMKVDLEVARQQGKMKETLRLRQTLPLMAGETQQTLLKLINDNDVVIVLAKTGSGKTTQVPQIILDDKIMSGEGPCTNIVCTQPRRIAATSVAHRVAYERHDTIRSSVGYHIRHENWSPSPLGSITYCTTGILLNRLIANPQATLSSHSHIIVDEVHERDIQIDLVLSLLRKAIRARKATQESFPKVILMSATIDPTTFLDYFKQPAEDGTALKVDCLDVEGRRAHVETHYLPEILTELSQGGDLHPSIRQLIQGGHHQSSARHIEHEMHFSAQKIKLGKPLSSENGANENSPLQSAVDETDSAELTGPMRVGLAVSVIVHIAKTKPDGDVLVFFPGSTDMEKVELLLTSGRFASLGLDFLDPNRFRLFKLHSLRRETNDQVFEPVPEGCRRIILTTNIAETSITLPDVVYVVDTGKERNSLFDPSTLARSLPYTWISKTSSIQRRGRAGRVRNGHYYALFSKERHDSLRPMQRPKIEQSDLAEMALQFKAFPQHGDVESFLLETIDPPTSESVASAIRQLQSLGALTESGDITDLGRLLWRLGVHPALGKGILLGSLFGCLEPMLIIACHDPGAPLVSTLELSIDRLRAVKQQYLPEFESDFAWIIEAFREYHAANLAGDENLMQELRDTKHIRHRAYLDMMMTSKALHDVLAEVGFVPSPQPEKTIFESLPDSLNANSDNMVLVKALLINTVSAELAAWRGATSFKGRQYGWSTDSRDLKGMLSKHGVNEANTRRDRRKKKRYRSHGRLMAYTWKQAGLDGPDDVVWLEQASMVTPLMAILFCRSLKLQIDEVLELNEWLRLRLSAPDDVPSEFSDRAAVILTELRKTIDRFVNLAWLELERLNYPRGPHHSGSHRQATTPNSMGLELRNVMVEAVVKMLDVDEAYWREWRKRRRVEIALDVERRKREEEEAEAVVEDEGQGKEHLEDAIATEMEEMDSDAEAEDDVESDAEGDLGHSAANQGLDKATA
ncbi:uncharacterized protein PV07_04427 [Cladophialophora immunda]|uniref:RNA helicase n=1 Tax=Cladophialophora immunda TaxID=569365 RepID=A0A0D2DB46_9EURO|nr:uncharacterized protein PV07_04427 [Cladophialophora immunda]KIW32914.1 hypothetical protein PV07_04427 [Cladophialophora immunda]OQV06816.1 hypothetical protein CLAIMM_11336 isoform 1 [Cladophialophora immunda]